MNNKLIIFSKFFLLILIFYYLFENNHLDISLITVLRNNIFLNFWFFILILSTLLLGSYRWLIILKNSNIKIKFFDVFKIIYICSFFNNFMFGNIGGDVLRVFYATKISKNNKLKNGFTVLIDRVFGLIGLICLGIISYLFILFDAKEFQTIFYILFILFILFFCIFLFRFFFIKNKKIKTLIDFFSLNINLFIVGVLISIILFFTVHLTIFFISNKIFLFNIEISYIFFVNFISSLAGALPLTPGGIGLSEASFVFINKNIFKVYLENLANIIIYYRILIFIFSVPSLYFFFNYKKIKL